MVDALLDAAGAADDDVAPEAAERTLVVEALATSTGAAVVDAAAVVDEVDWAAGDVPDAGVGGASIRMKAAKFTMSEEKSEAGLALLVLFTRLVVLSGDALNWQFGSFSRSFGKASLVMPCSTL